MSSVRKAKRILKKLGYKIIKSKGNGAFLVDEPNGGRIIIFGYPRTDYRWLRYMKEYKLKVWQDTSNYYGPNKYLNNDTSAP